MKVRSVGLDERDKYPLHPGRSKVDLVPEKKQSSDHAWTYPWTL